MKSETISSVAANKFDEILLEGILDGISTAQNLRVQIAVFWGTAVLILLGFAFNGRNGSIVILSGLIMLIYVPIDAVIRSNIVRMVVSAYRFGIALYPERHDMYLYSINSLALGIRDPEQIKKLDFHNRTRPYLAFVIRNPTYMGAIIPLSAGLFLIAIGALLMGFYGWSVL